VPVLYRRDVMRCWLPSDLLVLLMFSADDWVTLPFSWHLPCFCSLVIGPSFWNASNNGETSFTVRWIGRQLGISFDESCYIDMRKLETLRGAFRKQISYQNTPLAGHKISLNSTTEETPQRHSVAMMGKPRRSTELVGAYPGGFLPV